MTTRAELAEIMGEPAVEALIAWRPGCRWRVPKTAARIEPIVGPSAADRLASGLGGIYVTIPRGGPYRHVDRGQLAKLDAAGLSAAAIADRLGCTMRTVHRARARLRQR